MKPDPLILPRLVEADLVALSYTGAGVALGLVTICLAFSAVPFIFVLAYGGLTGLMFACALFIQRAARPGFLMLGLDRESGQEGGA